MKTQIVRQSLLSWRRLAISALVALSFTPAIAAPRGIADCEAISQPDAYNNCLASFGPTRGGGGKLGPVPRAARGRATRRQNAEGPSRRNGVTVERKGGRVRATIDIKRK